MLVAVFVVLAASGARAHEGDPNIETAITTLSPPVAGASVSVVEGSIVPELSAYDPTSTPLEVLGRDGVPFLRLGPGGTEGNVSSPDLYLSESPSGEAGVPAGVHTGARPRWAFLSRRPAWVWFDQRVPAAGVAPPAVRDRPTATLLERFVIPLRSAGRPVRAEGVVVYVPPRGGPVASMTSPLRPAPGVTVALLPGRFPDVFLQNSGSSTVTVLGESGEPFAQISSHGVRVNLRSPIYDADASARGQVPQVHPDLSAPPLWRTVSSAPSFDWFDPRPHFLAHWTIPLRVGRRQLDVRGVLRFSGPTTLSQLLAPHPATRRGHSGHGPGAGLWVALALGGLALLAGGVWARTKGRQSSR